MNNHGPSAFPIREDITVLPADDPKKLRLGWVIKETIGMCIINDYAISRITVDDGIERVAPEDEVYERQLKRGLIDGF